MAARTIKEEFKEFANGRALGDLIKLFLNKEPPEEDDHQIVSLIPAILFLLSVFLEYEERFMTISRCVEL